LAQPYPGRFQTHANDAQDTNREHACKKMVGARKTGNLLNRRRHQPDLGTEPETPHWIFQGTGMEKKGEGHPGLVGWVFFLALGRAWRSGLKSRASAVVASAETQNKQGAIERCDVYSTLLIPRARRASSSFNAASVVGRPPLGPRPPVRPTSGFTSPQGARSLRAQQNHQEPARTDCATS